VFFFKPKKTTFNDNIEIELEFSNYIQNDPFASSLAFSYLFHAHIFAWVKDGPLYEFTLSCGFFYNIFKEWFKCTQSTSNLMGGKYPKEGAYNSPHPTS
jgi:hypothetical protein